jgi:TRAP-type C4-dicarboxylate transport system substrate-binding protein
MTQRRNRRPLKALTMALGLAALAACGGGDGAGGGNVASGGGNGGGCGSASLRLTHQFPAATKDEGDFRSVLAERFADQVREKTDGKVKIQIFPNNTLGKATEQYDSMMSGATHMSVFPLDYASGRVKEFSITLMPALVRNHEQAQAWQDAEIGKRIDQLTQDNGVKILTWVWNAGAIGTKGEPVVAPEDVRKGMTMRAAGSYVEKMLESAGAGISSLPSSEIYTAMQTGVLDAAVTSTSSFESFKLQEQVKSFTSPSQNTFWFMFEPLIISKAAFDGLCQEQQQVLEDVGADLQDFAYSASEEDDARVEKVFADAGVKVMQMDDAAFGKWRELAQAQWQDYEKAVPTGKELLDLAQQVAEQ